MESEKLIIIKSGKCDWGKCLFCGWGPIDFRKMSIHEMKKFIDEKFAEVKGAEWVKVYNSGSFLDENQIPKAMRSYIVRKAEEKGAGKLVVECLPKFITDEALKDIESTKAKVYIGVGLEVADNDTLKKLGKGVTTVESFAKAAELAHKHGIGIRAYLLANPPFVNDVKESLHKSIEFALQHSDYVSVCNVFPHAHSKVFDMWVDGSWKPLSRKEFEGLMKDYDDKRIEKHFDEFVHPPRWKVQPWIQGATLKELLHPYYAVWQDYINRFWEPEKGKDVLLFIPCAYRKPYFNSQLHKAIFGVLNKLPISNRLQLAAISSPGVIPYEFANYYPFNRYNWPEWEETPEIKRKYTEVTQMRIENFLNAHGSNYKRIFCYFKPTSESYIALKKACERLGIELVSCLKDGTYESIKDEKNPLSKEAALEDLRTTLSAL